jgi:hypothetical protein
LARAYLTTALAALALASCGKADNEPGPGGVSVGEARALEEAAEVLDAQRPPPAAAPAAPASVPAPNTQPTG